jgi:hypothetical protein
MVVAAQQTTDAKAPDTAADQTDGFSRFLDSLLGKSGT